MSTERSLAIFGSTGSIGKSTLSVVREHPGRFSIFCLISGSSVDELVAQAGEFRPRYVGLNDLKKVSELQSKLNTAGISCEIVSGAQEIAQLAANGSYDLMIAAIVGSAGLLSVISALDSGKNVALANKESLVCAGQLIELLLTSKKGTLVPVDSEHSAIFQLLQQEQKNDISRIILTASGGPFRSRSPETFSKITVDEALKHPKWNMGRKITIDSATLFNKALEVIEAFWLYKVNPDQIEVVVHPQSIIHSMVEFCDGSTFAQMSYPDMRGPIGYALSYPNGRLSGCVTPMKFAQIKSLEFFEVDPVRFPSLNLAYWALKEKKGSGVVLNASNEVAVERFLSEEISFPGIFKIVSEACEYFTGRDFGSLEELLALEAEVRQYCGGLK